MEHEFTARCGNVYLRPLAEGDIEHLREWRNDKSNTVYLRQLPYITPEMQEQWYAKYLADDDEICFAVCETEQLNRIVGSLSIYDRVGSRAEFGRLLIGDSEAHGRGIGTNAVRAAVWFAFETLGLEELTLHVFADNAAAVKIYQKVGFRVIDDEIADGKKEHTMRISAEMYREEKRRAAE